MVNLKLPLIYHYTRLNNLNATAISKASGISLTTVKRILSGHNRVTNKTADKLSRMLNTNLANILQQWSKAELYQLFGDDDVPF
jgi:plasmid maintenance system antidote protein VapI